ncbi:MAG: hypothetical protein ATN36_02100 [Epulopiscium sp. Nele67-Bin005]|nr:MAG: hypothetical protein ATN36_02100 [Epulopiscium sp. Nele67-Bin005]
MLEGQFVNDFELYFADHFPMRDKFIAIKSYTELFLQKTDNNGVFIGADGYFLNKFEEPDYEQATRNIDYINKFSQNFNTYLLISQTSTKVLEDKLPPYAQNYNEENFIEFFYKNIFANCINLGEMFNTYKHDYIFYKTDHHWTTRGAYYGYVEFCKIYGISPIDLKLETVSTDFYGTLFSKGNFSFATPDAIEIFVPENEVTVNYVGSNTITNSLYEMSYLETKDHYSIFLDNNHPLIQISTDAQTSKKLLIIKDSYANCFIPFLVGHFDEIHVIDLRYINFNIANYARTNNLEDILILYNSYNIANENKLSLLGE